MQGPARDDAAPTPVLCAQNGASLQRTQFSDLDWYLTGKGGCHVKYDPDPTKISTPLSDGGALVQFFFDAGKQRRVNELLDSLAASVKRGPVSVGQKIDLQLTLWELVVALQWRRDIRLDYDPPVDQPAVDRMLQSAFAALRPVLLSPAEIEALPDTLQQLPQASGEAVIAASVAKMLRHDPAIWEDLHPRQLHAAFSEGRMFGRMFMTTDDPAELQSLKRVTTGLGSVHFEGFDWAPATTAKPAPDDGLGDGRTVLSRLQQQVGSLRLILVLYLNVLDSSFEPVATPVVAGWREIWFDGKVNTDKDYGAIDPQFHMREIDYRKNFEADPAAVHFVPRYVVASERAVSRPLFTDANPVYPGTLVTTTRAACMSCHAQKVRSFDVRGPRPLGFGLPLVKAPHELYDQVLEQKVREQLSAWSKKYSSPPEK